MPFYEYECASCKYYTEVMQKISDPPLQKCPSCGKKTLKKLVSAPVFRLKGGGWYETDFKSDKEGKRNLADREEPAAKSEDSKPAKAPESKPAAAAAPAVPAASGSGSNGSGGSSASASAAASGRSRRSGSRGSAPARTAEKSGPVARATAKPKVKAKAKAPARKKSRR